MSGCGTCPTSAICSNCAGMAELEARSSDERRSLFLPGDRRARRALRRRRAAVAQRPLQAAAPRRAWIDVKNETMRESLRGADDRGHAAALPTSRCSPAARRPAAAVADLEWRSPATRGMLQGLRRLLIHVIGGVGIRRRRRAPPAAVEHSAEAPEVVLRLDRSAQSTDRSPAQASKTIEQDSWSRVCRRQTPSASASRTPQQLAARGDARRAAAQRARRALPLRRRRLALSVPLSDRSAAHDSHARRRRRRAHARGLDRRARRRAARRRALGRRQDDDVARRGRARRARAQRRAHHRAPGADGGGWLVGGTPWPGEGGFAENRSVPLRGLILLEQADRDELVAAVAGARAGDALSLPLPAAVGLRSRASAPSTTSSASCARCPRSSIAIARAPTPRSACSQRVGGVG